MRCDPCRAEVLRWALLLAGAAPGPWPFPTLAAGPCVDPWRPVVALIVGGYLVPPSGYSYCTQVLERMGMRAIALGEGSTMRRQMSVDEASERVLSELANGPPGAALLVAHSRGAKAVVRAAARTPQRVAGLVLLDPVDATDFDPVSVLADLQGLGVPTAVLGAGAGHGDCAPPRSDYLAFFGALATDDVPRLLGVLPRVGHLQFVDQREATLDVCSAGPDPDSTAQAVVVRTLRAWAEAVGAPRAAQGAPIAAHGGSDRPQKACAGGRGAAVRPGAGEAPQNQPQRPPIAAAPVETLVSRPQPADGTVVRWTVGGLGLEQVDVPGGAIDGERAHRSP